MAKNASTPQLATSITNHLKDTNEQISRLVKLPVLNLLQRKACNGRNIKREQ
jgi:ferritin-like metal-binding protein YciE